MNKKDLSESDICAKYITPAIQRAGWDDMRQIRREVSFTDGRIIVRGRLHTRGQRKRADYILSFHPELPLALVEAKDNNHSVGAGMQQAIAYAETLDIPFVFASNGDAFIEHDRSGPTPREREIPLDQFPSPQELWDRYRGVKEFTPEVEQLVRQPYHADGTGKEPRYYQRIAVNRTIDAIARGQNRVLLVMATGTGKTYTAFQIIWRLWKSQRKKRMLFLADRNILVDQTRTNDFKPFGKAMTKITGRKADPSYEVYLALYQAVTGPEDEQKIFRNFSPEFFDLIIVDECHRGSAADDSAWREILEYFSSATQIGMTATPKETKYVSSSHYFGPPVYTYSLREGIDDGFLAPYKVVRIDIDKDLTGWRPEAGKVDKHGAEIVDRIYNQRDFDRELVLEKRTELVASKVAQFLAATDPMSKTIVFCEDIDHAERMRSALVNLCQEHVGEHPRYVMRITGDNDEGKKELDNFIDPESLAPVIATTSKLLTTGVDAKTCKLIVLDQRIQSMTEFKQTIGRGTRIAEDFGKMSFTIMDFRRATELFADPDFDGDPVDIYNPSPGDPPLPPDDDDDEEGGRTKYYVDDVDARVIAEREQFIDPKTGKLITESLKDYTRNSILAEYASLDDFLTRWNDADKKMAVLAELEECGVLFDELREAVGKDCDAFDLICHVAFDRPPLTRKERADSVRKRDYFARYGDKARAVLEALLEKYADQGIGDLESMEVLKVAPISHLGTPVELIGAFGGRQRFQEAIIELQQELYASAE